MNEQKLISLIAKKQQYKNTKPVQADILAKKLPAVYISITAIYRILTERYNTETKLYAIRYLKDCFEKGNPTFIAQSEEKILPLLLTIIDDSHDEQAILRYGADYSKADDLSIFKSLLTSFFIMTRECIEKWAEWIPDPKRGFFNAQKQIIDKYGVYEREFQYFREQNENIFRENCRKNGLDLQASIYKPAGQLERAKPKVMKPSQTKKQDQFSQKASVKVDKNQQRILSIIHEVQGKSQFMTSQQLNGLEQKLNVAVSNYLDQAEHFDENFMSSSLQAFETVKHNIITREQQCRKQNKKSQLELENNASQISKHQGSKIEKKSSKVESQSSRKQIVRTKPAQKQKPFQSQEFRLSIKSLNGNSNPIESAHAQDTGQANGSNVNKPTVSEAVEKKEERVNFSVSQSEQSEGEKDSLSYIQKKKTAKFANIEPSAPQETSHEVHNEIKSSSIQSPGSKRSKNSQDSNIRHNSQIQSRNKNIENEEKTQMQMKISNLERQLNLLQQSQKKMVRKVRESVSQNEMHMLKKQLMHERTAKSLLNQQVNELRNQIRKLRGESIRNKVNAVSGISSISMSRERDSQMAFHAKSYKHSRTVRVVEDPNETGSNFNAFDENRPSVDPFSEGAANSGSYRSQIDEDYANNMTDYHKIRHWLSEENVLLFKRSVLGLSNVFFQNQLLEISKLGHVYAEDSSSYLKITYNYKFRVCQQAQPNVTYRNIAEIDLWKKPLQGKLDTFVQEVVGKMCSVPLKIMKASISCDGNNIFTFLLPFLYYSYLIPNEFQPQQFDQIFSQKLDSVFKSKVFMLNPNLGSNPASLSKIFKNSQINQNLIEFCLSEESSDKILMVRLQLLKNQKGVLRVIPLPALPQTKTKAKQLLNNLLFLLAE